MADDTLAREEQLRQSEERYRTLAEAAHDMIFIVNREGYVEYANSFAAKHFALRPEEIIGKRLEELFPPDVVERQERSLRRVFQTGESVYAEQQTPFPDRALWLGTRLVPLRTEGDEVRAVMGISRDITERKQTEDLFRTLAESSPIGIYIVQRGTFRFVNAKFQEFTGYSEDELLGGDALSLVIPEDRETVKGNAVEMLKGERTTPYEYRIADKAGNPRWILETVASIQYEGQRAAMGNFIDISRRKGLEEQLAHLASHDPLTGLPNRRSLEEAMNRAVARGRRGAPGALLFLDFDNFKEVNDALGHAAGDKALTALAQLLRDTLRAEDLLVRLGGDEFAVLLDGATGENVNVVATRILRAVEEFPLTLDNRSFRLSLSAGAIAIDGELTPTVLLSRADAAMYEAKAQGGNRVVLAK
ncbi:MAG: PAS domain S-box protein [Chloroflexi bacterium]|nr:PAS domain S-box protein [Chloroflexota bacterium]